MAFEQSYEHYTRHTPWGGGTGDGEIVVLGLDWSEATFTWSFAAADGETALFTLSNAAAGTEGVSAVYDNNYVDPDTGAEVGATIITPQIDEDTFEGLEWGDDSSAPLVLRHELLIKPSGEPQRAYCYGDFTIYPGIGD